MQAALNHFKLLQKNERAPQQIKTVEQGKEPQEFWGDFGLSGAPVTVYEQAGDWDHLFIDVSLFCSSDA